MPWTATKTTTLLNSKMTDFDVNEDGKLVKEDEEEADFEEDLTFDG